MELVLGKWLKSKVNLDSGSRLTRGPLRPQGYSRSAPGATHYNAAVLKFIQELPAIADSPDKLKRETRKTQRVILDAEKAKVPK